MNNSRVTIGLLLPLQSNLAVNDLAASISVYEGANFVGRNDINISDKRVSRKHICLHCSSNGVVELVVEGPNPVIFKSGSRKRRLSSQDKILINDGDILELIPGNHYFKYVKAGEHVLSYGRDLHFSNKALKQADEALFYENHQIRDLQLSPQNLEDNSLFEVKHLVVSRSGSSRSTADADKASSNSMAIHQFDVSSERLSLVFRLMRVQGLPEWANKYSVAINDVIEMRQWPLMLLSLCISGSSRDMLSGKPWQEIVLLGKIGKRRLTIGDCMPQKYSVVIYKIN